MKPSLRALLATSTLTDAVSVRRAISVQSEIEVRFEFTASLSETLERVREERYDVLLLDIDVAGGPAGVRTLFEQTRAVPVIALLNENDVVLGLALVRMGAQDYLIKRLLSSDQLVRSFLCAIERARVNRARDALTSGVAIAG